MSHSFTPAYLFLYSWTQYPFSNFWCSPKFSCCVCVSCLMYQICLESVVYEIYYCLMIQGLFQDLSGTNYLKLAKCGFWLIWLIHLEELISQTIQKDSFYHHPGTLPETFSENFLFKCEFPCLWPHLISNSRITSSSSLFSISFFCLPILMICSWILVVTLKCLKWTLQHISSHWHSF